MSLISLAVSFRNNLVGSQFPVNEKQIGKIWAISPPSTKSFPDMKQDDDHRLDVNDAAYVEALVTTYEWVEQQEAPIAHSLYVVGDDVKPSDAYKYAVVSVFKDDRFPAFKCKRLQAATESTRAVDDCKAGCVGNLAGEPNRIVAEVALNTSSVPNGFLFVLRTGLTDTDHEYLDEMNAVLNNIAEMVAAHSQMGR